MKISIITVVRNNKKFIESCIRSVIDQTYRDIEYIIVDGASTDGTLGIIDKYRDKISKIISEPDKGHIYAMNKGIGLSSGDVIGFLHSDDFYANDKAIEKIAGAFTENNVDSVYADLIYVRKTDPEAVLRRWHGGGYDPRKIRWGWMPPHPTFFVKKKIYETCGAFDTGFKISTDYENILRLLYKHKISAYYLGEVIVKMRFGGVSNKSLQNILIKSAEDYKACRMYGLGIPTLIMKNMRKLPQFL